MVCRLVQPGPRSSGAEWNTGSRSCVSRAEAVGRQACGYSCVKWFAPRLPTGCVVVVMRRPSSKICVYYFQEAGIRGSEGAIGGRSIAWQGRDVGSDYLDLWTCKLYRVFADHGLRRVLLAPLHYSKTNATKFIGEVDEFGWGNSCLNGVPFASHLGC